MYSIIEINGGIGKSVMASAVIAGIKKKYPERNVLVITAYPEVFYNNPNVHRVFKFGTGSYFYEESIKDKDVLFFCDEPYRSNGYMRKDRHLITAWSEILGVESEIEPKIYLKTLEENVVKNNSNFNKPLMIFQPFGGASNQKHRYSWNRDIPVRQAQELANSLSKRYHILQPVIDRHIKLENCEHVSLDLRELFVYIKYADMVVGIDSFVQHARKALGGKSVVFWVTNTPTVFGYEENVNILPSQELKETNISSYLEKYDFTGSRTYDYPFDDDNIFDIQAIISKF
jgi:ADP-heptose:LPS heptosyltransferase